MDEKSGFLKSFVSFISSIIDEHIDEKWNEYKSDVRDHLEDSTQSFFSNLDWEEIFKENISSSTIDSFIEDSNYIDRHVIKRIQECESAIEDVKPIKDIFYAEIRSDEFKKVMNEIFSNNSNEPYGSSIIINNLKSELENLKKNRVDLNSELTKAYAEIKKLQEENAKYASIKDQSEMIRKQDLEMVSLQRKNFELENKLKQLENSQEIINRQDLEIYVVELENKVNELQDSNMSLLKILNEIKKSLPDILG